LLQKSPTEIVPNRNGHIPQPDQLNPAAQSAEESARNCHIPQSASLIWPEWLNFPGSKTNWHWRKLDKFIKS
jgi:hypothetical protein